MHKLKEEFIKRIYDDPIAIGKIADAGDVKIFTVRRWLDDRSDQLTKYCVLNAIANHYGINRIDSLVKLQLNDQRKKAVPTAKEPQ